MTLDPHLQVVRLRAERALLSRLNAGYGFADARIPSEVYLRDPDARARVGASPLRPRGTHADALSRVAAEIASAERTLGDRPSRLAALAQRVRLSSEERALLSIAVAYAVDPDTREICDALCGRRFPALYADVCRDIQPELADADAWFRAVHPAAVARRTGWIAVSRDEVALTPRVAHWMMGDERLFPDGLARSVEAADVYLAPELSEAIARVAERVRAAPSTAPPVVVIQGAQGAGKAAAAFALSRALGRSLLAAPLPPPAEAELVRDSLSEALLRDAIAYLPGAERLAAAQADDRSLALAIDSHPDLCILAIRDAGLALPLERAYHTIRIASPGLAVRTEAWRRAVGPDAADMLAARHVIGPGAIAEVVRDARAMASASGREPSTPDIESAIARRLSLNLGPFASRISRRARFSEMIVPEDVSAALADIVSMVRQRSRILESWGYGEHLGLTRGVSALFSGQPGTGKTMAATAISGELGLELFRIDLSAVVSKWVGETEKHLARIFDEAQSAEAMLLFDEADALFGKRTEVKTATDRYANLEINYILSRMESFDGISILTTNHEAAIDTAFMRRPARLDSASAVHARAGVADAEHDVAVGLDLRMLRSRSGRVGTCGRMAARRQRAPARCSGGLAAARLR